MLTFVFIWYSGTSQMVSQWIQTFWWLYLNEYWLYSHRNVWIHCEIWLVCTKWPWLISQPLWPLQMLTFSCEEQHCGSAVHASTMFVPVAQSYAAVTIWISPFVMFQTCPPECCHYSSNALYTTNYQSPTKHTEFCIQMSHTILPHHTLHNQTIVQCLSNCATVKILIEGHFDLKVFLNCYRMTKAFGRVETVADSVAWLLKNWTIIHGYV